MEREQLVRERAEDIAGGIAGGVAAVVGVVSPGGDRVQGAIIDAGRAVGGWVNDHTRVEKTDVDRMADEVLHAPRVEPTADGSR